MSNFDNGPQFQNYNQPPHPNQPWMPTPPARTNGKSIAALVLGICAIIVPYLGFIIGIVGMIISSLALGEIKKKGEQGKGLAIAGLVTSIIGTAMYAFILLILILIFAFAADSYDSSNFSYNVAGN
ncbi:DUF4190 domain-containing protein [Paenibacillus radicis (ex Gao et al. 2016)]|uniref:DUF4190 domain-containing protein n=1 Tax=Paenibacillus radicis (ex Gao et al. 2016) TaxID=1737354 RepID=A0A917M3C8_9BACL|nr:DUF4190 domain-containing protein [Paenibacillus radicis (ex Gao et al. 2016)]GGG75138.1 hypothetical protein GCM10010918_34200 [Paenibacillus radicis (ex Gao et al. 2016)]